MRSLSHYLSHSLSLFLFHSLSVSLKKMDKKPCISEEAEVRKGPWTMEEDMILINYIANHGEGAWNSLAKAAGI